MTLSRKRGYLRVEDDEQDVVERWSLPDYDEKNAPPRQTAMNYDPAWHPDAFEEIEEEPAPQPLTASQLEAIQQSGYDEGFAEGRSAGHEEGLKTGHEEGYAKGHEEGREAGHAEGLEAAKEEIKQHCEALQKAVAELSVPLKSVDSEVESTLLDVVVALTRELIAVEVATNPQVILETVRSAVSSLPMADRQVKVSLHPDDYQIVLDALGEQGIADRQWKMMAEPALNRGDVHLVCDDSSVDYRMEERVKSLLTQFIGNNQVKKTVNEQPEEPASQPEDQ
ncbi:flagellar assembly protein FliH [Parasalinivibrio latis]|uniref:flagellar assembly protein FliH n=1 Tax=Parasalinivibrio latis TaxID=2952610 RepID=UPI0030E4594C